MAYPTPSHGFRAQTLRALLAVERPLQEALRDALETSHAPRFVTTPCDDLHAVQSLTPLSRFDLLFFEWREPDDLGIAADLRKEAPHIAMVAVSGTVDANSARRLSSIGGQDILDKNALHQELVIRVARDSVERQRLVEEARRRHDLAQSAEHELQRFIDNSVDAMAVIDATGRVLHWNPAGAALTGRSIDDLVDHTLPWDIEQTPFTLDGKRGPAVVEVQTTDITWYGASATLVSLRDVTERTRAEALKGRLVSADRLKSIGQLAAGVAHEINNPATFVLANSQSLLERIGQLNRATEELQQRLHRWPPPIRDEVQSLLEEHDVQSTLFDFESILRENQIGLDRIADIVGALRSFARADRREVSMVNMNDVVADAATIVQNEIRPRAHFLRHLEDVPPIAGHRGQLAQVLVNLLVNAAHALPDGKQDEHTVTVTTQFQSGRIVLTVHDTGRGIPEEIQKNMFDPFFTTKKDGEGTGLGLSLSLEIVREHGGEISVQSNPDEGTSVVVSLPLDTGLHVRRTLPRAVVEVPKERAARILVIDDEVMILRAFRRILARNHEVQTADGGNAAKDILRRDADFDVIFCDLMMPDTNGAELYGWLSRRIPHLIDRIVFVSGGAFTPRMREFADRVDNQMLEKPVSAATLRKTIQRMLGTVDDRP